MRHIHQTIESTSESTFVALTFVWDRIVRRRSWDSTRFDSCIDSLITTLCCTIPNTYFDTIPRNYYRRLPPATFASFQSDIHVHHMWPPSPPQPPWPNSQQRSTLPSQLHSYHHFHYFRHCCYSWLSYDSYIGPMGTGRNV